MRAPRGTPIEAPGEGTVVKAGWEQGYGWTIEIDHGYGIVTRYAHTAKILVKLGQRVERGEVIARVGATNQGSVVRSWLLELAEEAFKKDRDLSGIEGYVEDSGEGRWTLQQAIETGVPSPVISAALFQRFRSRIPDPLSDRESWQPLETSSAATRSRAKKSPTQRYQECR